MPVFNNLPSRATYRLLTTFFLVTTGPLIFYFTLVANNADLPGTTYIQNPLAYKIPIISICSLWILYVFSGATDRRAWPLSQWGDAADLCKYLTPLIIVLLICFCFSAFLPNADLLPINTTDGSDSSNLPLSLLPLFALVGLGSCLACCIVKTEHVEGYYLFGCWICALSVALLFFLIFLGFKLNALNPLSATGQASYVETRYTWFSTFFPTFLIDIGIMPCVVHRFKQQYEQRNASEAKTAICTGWFFFLSIWVASLIVRLLFVYDESNLSETWMLLPGGKHFNDSYPSTTATTPLPYINPYQGNSSINQFDIYNTLPEKIDGKYIRCIVDYPNPSSSSSQSTLIDLTKYNLNTNITSYLSLWSVCSSICYKYDSYGLVPTSQPYPTGKLPITGQQKYNCNCYSSIKTIATYCNQVVNKYNYNCWTRTPSFDCIDPMSGRMAGRNDRGCKEKNSNNPFSPDTCDYSSARKTTIQFETYKYIGCYSLKASSLSSSSISKTMPTEVGQVDSIGACANLCYDILIQSGFNKNYPIDLNQNQFGLAGNKCFCGSNQKIGSLTKKPKKACENIVATAIPQSQYKPTIIPSTLTELHGTANEYLVWYSRTSSRWKNTKHHHNKIVHHNNTWNYGMPSIINVTTAQIKSYLNATETIETIEIKQQQQLKEGSLVVSNQSTPFNLGKVGGPGSGEFVVNEFNVPDVTWTSSTNLLCTSRVSLGNTFGVLGVHNRLSLHVFSLLEAKQMCKCGVCDEYDRCQWCRNGDTSNTDGVASLTDGTNPCVGVVEYPPLNDFDVVSFYLCYDYQCPLVLGGQSTKPTKYSPIVHVRTDIPLTNLTSKASSSTPQCVQYTTSDTVRMTYVQHYLPILLCYCLLTLTLVASLLRHPVVTVAGSAYNKFETERKRREEERLRTIDMERKEMDEARRIGRELGQHDEGWNAPLMGGQNNSSVAERKSSGIETKKYDASAMMTTPTGTSIKILIGLNNKEDEFLTRQEQFVNMLDEFSVVRDPTYMVSVLHSLKALFIESSELRQEPSTKIVLIQRAKIKRIQDADCWTEEVARAFGECLKSLSLLGRLGIPSLVMSDGGGESGGGGVSEALIN